MNTSFFKIPKNASPELIAHIEHLKSINSKNNFVNKLVYKIGYPIWDQTFSNVKTSNEIVQGSKLNALPSIVFWITPFRDNENGNITGYLKFIENDSFYRSRIVDKQDWISLTAHESDTAEISKYLQDLSLFNFFEQKINSLDTLHLPTLPVKKIWNTSMNFGGGENGKKSYSNKTTETCYYLETCTKYEMDEFIWVRMAADYLEICKTDFIGCVPDYFGENGSGGSGAPTGWGGWGPAYPISGEGGGGSGIGGVNLNRYFEFDPFLPEIDPDEAWWNDNTTSFPSLTLPTWSNMLAAYPLDATGHELEAAQVYQLIGGPLLAMRNASPAAFANACAARISRVLNYSGVSIPNISGQTYQGGDGKYYFISAAKLYNWMVKSFGTSNVISVNRSQGGTNGANYASFINGTKGIYLMKPINIRDFGATGHATLWNGSACVNGASHCYFESADRIILFKLN